MKPSAAVKLLLLVLSAVAGGSYAAASSERPRLEDYPSSYEFLQALQAWNREHPEGSAPVRPAATTATPAAPQATAVLDPTSELAPPPIEITGPENLDHAVEQAKSIEHPNYKEKIRYHRTTHLSFPLPKIDGQDMSQASVGDALAIEGKTEAEKKKALEHLTVQLDQDQRKLQDKTIEPTTSVAPVAGVSDTMLGGGARGRVDITVIGH